MGKKRSASGWSCDASSRAATAENGRLRASRLRFERHLAACPACRGFVTQLREALVVAGSLPPEPFSDDSKSALLEAFRAWRVGR